MKTRKLTALVSVAAIAATMLTQVTVPHAAGPTTLTVGTDKQYKTIREAYAAAKAINPQSESERVTIDVDPGDYEEQLRIDDVKYLTFEQTPGTEARATARAIPTLTETITKISTGTQIRQRTRTERNII